MTNNLPSESSDNRPSAVAVSLKPSGVPWLGDIPEGWDLVRAKNLVSIVNGSDPITEGQIPVYGSGMAPFKTCGEFRDGPAVIVGRKGSIGNVLFVKDRFWNVDTAFAVFSNSRDYLIRYYFYCAQCFDYRFYVSQTTLPSMTQTDYLRMALPFPPLPEQRAIADFLDERCAAIDAIVEEAKAGIEEYAKWKQSVVFEAVTKGLSPHAKMKDSGVEWIGEVPSHWEIMPLKRHVKMLTPMRDKPEHLDGPIPWIRIEDFNGKYIAESKDGFGVSEETVKEMNLKVYPVGTILCTSSCDLGKCAIVSKPLVSNQRFIGIIPDGSVSGDYLYYLMCSNAERLNMLSTGTIQANLSRVEFERLRVQIPPLPEQRAIATYLDERCSAIDALIEEKKTLIEDLSVYKKSLIYETVTGKRKVG